MFTRFRHVFGVIFFLLVASCSGGGCSSGCGGCGGTTPLPGGFPKDKAIQNAASVRVSRPGLDFVETNLPAIATKIASAPGGTLTIPIPDSDLGNSEVVKTGCVLGACALRVDVDPHLCPGGPDPKATPPKCTASIGIGKATFKIDSVKPDNLTISAVIPLELDNTPVTAAVSGEVVGASFGPTNLTIHAAYGSNGSCNGPTPTVTANGLPITISIPLVAETIAPRDGYTKIDIANAVINLDAISANDVQLCADCGGGLVSDVCDAVLNAGFIKNAIIGPLKSGLGAQVKGLLANQLCTAPTPALNPPCPTGSEPDAGNKFCVYSSKKDTCVSTLLGTDAHIDLGGLLKSISPGTAGGVDFGLAAAGAMNPAPGLAANAQGRTPNGVTLSMLGGVLPQPQSKCVPQADLVVPTGIPLPDELAPTKADVATTPHIGIALAGRFLDYSFGSVYNSGLLCLGVSSEQFDQLRAGLLSIIIPSLKTLTFEEGDGAAAIATRPQAPPTVKIGGGTNANSDALLQITLPKFALDFYLWHLDRYVRVFTFQADLLIPVNLQTGKDPKTNPNGGILPSIGDIKVSNGSVTNADLLMDDPVLVSSALSGLLGGIGKQLVGNGFAPIDLSGALKSFGLGMEIGKIGKLTKGTDDYVGIFANLSKVAGAATVEADTHAVLVSKTVPAEHMQLSTMDRASLPELVVDASSPLEDGRHAIEYSWWVDNGSRSPWTSEKHLVIKDDQLLLQGRHTLRVSARVVGQADTEDATPAEVPFTIDAVAPFVTVEKDTSGKEVTVKAWDIVSSKDALTARYRLDGNDFGAWGSVADIAQLKVGGAETVDVEVKDEEGNVRSVHQELIRGKADSSLAAATSGCGCSTPGSSSRTASGNTNGVLAAALGLVGLALIALRRRSAQGRLAARFVIGSKHAAIALASVTAVAATSQGCACGSEATDSGTGCGKDCNQECKPELAHGLPGSYTSIAKTSDNSIWVAGYNDALLSEGDSQLFGDLVVGKYDLGKQAVEWKTVDGLPVRSDPATCPDSPKTSWRNGEVDSGDDVGLWTSLQVSTDGRPMVSYYDATNKQLKYAVLTDANDVNSWKTIVLKTQPGADIGRYSKMQLVGGKPVIAFLHIEPGNGGLTRSKVVVARANIEVPQDPTDFRFEDAAVEETNPCAASTCTASQGCVKSTGVCTPTVGGCTPADCGTGNACVTVTGKATCVAVKGATQTYPEVFGDYISLAQGAGQVGMVVYDRPHGNLVSLAQAAEGQWTRTILDGETGSRTAKTAIDTGDVGIAASLAIDNSGTWHITYVSGLDETLRYLTVTGGKPGKSEIIDDGSTVDGKAFADGKHVVGDDSAIHAEGDVITVYYQDATIGTLRRAAGTASGSTHKWDLRTLQQPNKFGGYFPQIVPGEDKVANFWEQTDHALKSRIGDVTILAP
jgi:MYXO-CTERM domain-containing protein